MDHIRFHETHLLIYYTVVMQIPLLYYVCMYMRLMRVHDTNVTLLFFASPCLCIYKH